MARGSINHLALTASDLARSSEFYDKVLGFMGYERVEVPEATQQSMKTRLHAWASPAGSITLRSAKGAGISKAHDRNAPGLNHLAFNADNRADVEKLHERLKEIGVQILDPPSEYSYFAGYYAVYFCDPDGLKIEFVHWPQPT
ncbi:MAG: VOC family protein [Candidatus Binataceae bacterium]|jgi:catechol 2,3-dioxygenase-like lactoylglutathione lyase family enzyme